MAGSLRHAMAKAHQALHGTPSKRGAFGDIIVPVTYLEYLSTDEWTSEGRPVRHEREWPGVPAKVYDVINAEVDNVLVRANDRKVVISRLNLPEEVRPHELDRIRIEATGEVLEIKVDRTGPSEAAYQLFCRVAERAPS